MNNLTAGRASQLLVRNTIWSFVGSGGPMLIAVVAIPVLIKGLGTVRFGVLTLAWMAIGYLSLFDFGLGRALTKLIAEKLALGLSDTIPGAFWDSLLLLAGIGLVGALFIWNLSNWLVGSMLRIPLSLHSEALACFHLIALAIPVVTVATGLRGFLEAHQKFQSVNVVRWLIGTLGFLLPVTVLRFSNRVDVTVGILSGVRWITLLAFFILCLRTDPSLWRRRAIGTTPVGPLLRFGGWITFDNVIGPLMITIDRFIVGSIISMNMVTYYVTPQEIITKLLLIPMALQQALFPLFSGADSTRKNDAKLLYRYSADIVFVIMFPLTIFFVAFAHNVMALWLGRVFADSSYRVLQILAVAALVNAMAHVPSSIIQASGRPELNAKLHAVELPFYLLTAWWMITHFGILGAALAWCMRAVVDSTAFFIMGYRVLPCRPFDFLVVGIGFFLIAADFFIVAVNSAIGFRLLYCIFASATVIVVSWSNMTRNAELTVLAR